MTEQFDRAEIQYVKGCDSPWMGIHTAADKTYRLTVRLPDAAPIETAQVVCKNLRLDQKLTQSIVGCLVYFTQSEEWGGMTVQRIEFLLGAALGRLQAETGAEVELARMAVSLSSGPIVEVSPIPPPIQAATKRNSPGGRNTSTECADVPSGEMDLLLLQAVLEEELGETTRLLAKGADPNVRGKHDWTPLLESISRSPELVELLLRSGADPDLCSNLGYSPLMRASGLGRLRAVRALVGAGADLMLRDNKNATALDMAVAEEQGHAVEYLAPIYAAAPGTADRRPSRAAEKRAKEHDVTRGESPRPAPYIAVPIFLSSTFRDMHAERDYLRDLVFPRVEEALKEWGVRIEAVDLRWGVDTSEHATEREKQLQVLRVCLDEIRRARPFVIALLGERYGWIPPEIHLREALHAAGVEGGGEPLSVTELELRYGVLEADQDLAFRAYVRKPIEWSKLVGSGQATEEQAALYTEESEGDRARIKALVEDLTQRFPRRISTYSAMWSKDLGALSGLESWGAAVQVHLLSDIRAHLASQYPAGPLSMKPRKVQLDRFKARLKHAAPCRGEQVDRLVDIALGSAREERPVQVLLGDEGSGKSSLIATLEDMLDAGGAMVLPWYVGATESSEDPDRMLLSWARELSRTLGLGPVDRTDELHNLFGSLLRQMQLQRRVVLLVDSVDRLGPGYPLKMPLPSAWPQNVRLLVTAETNTFDKWSAASTALQEQPLEALTVHESESIVLEVCERYHRNLPRAAIQILCDKRTGDNQRAGENPLWQTLAADSLNLLGSADYLRADEEYTGSAEERLSELLLESAQEMPATLAELYPWLLHRLTRTHGVPWVRGFVRLLAATRHGLRERDLRQLLPDVEPLHWQVAAFADLRRSLRMHLQRDALDAWGFTQRGLRHAAAETFPLEPEAWRGLHARIAQHLRNLPETDALRQREIMFHLLRSGSFEQAIDMLAHAFRVADAGGSAALGSQMITTIRDELLGEQDGLFLLRSLLRASPDDEEDLYQACEFVSWVLLEIVKDEASLPLRAEVGYEVVACHERLVASDPTPSRRRSLSVALGRHGEVLRYLGRLDDAEAQQLASLRLARDLLDTHRELPGTLSDVTVALGRLAKTLNTCGRPAEARKLRQESMLLTEGNLESDSDDEARMALVVDLVWLADDLLEGEDAVQAENALNRASTLMRSIDIDRVGTLPYRNQLSIIQERQGNAALQGGRWQDALDAYREAHSNRRHNAHDAPLSLEYRFNLAVIHEKLGDVYAHMDSTSAAANEYESALEIREDLLDRDPTNHLYLQGLSNTLACLRRLFSRNNPTVFLKRAQRDLEYWAQFVKSSTHPTARTGQFEAMVDFGNALVLAKRTSDAIATLSSALALGEGLTELPISPGTIRNVAVCAVKLGNLLNEEGRDRAPFEAYARGLRVLEGAPTGVRSDLRTRRLLAGVLFQCGQALVTEGSLGEAEPFLARTKRVIDQILGEHAALGPNLEQIHGLLNSP